jgi:hypothetical protein
MGHTFQAQAFGEVPVGGPQRLDTQGGNAYTVVGRSWAASQRASVRSGKYRSGLSVSGFTAATFSLAQVSRSASLSLGEGQAGQGAPARRRATTPRPAADRRTRRTHRRHPRSARYGPAPKRRASAGRPTKTCPVAPVTRQCSAPFNDQSTATPTTAQNRPRCRSHPARTAHASAAPVFWCTAAW